MVGFWISVIFCSAGIAASISYVVVLVVKEVRKNGSCGSFVRRKRRGEELEILDDDELVIKL